MHPHGGHRRKTTMERLGLVETRLRSRLASTANIEPESNNAAEVTVTVTVTVICRVLETGIRALRR